MHKIRQKALQALSTDCRQPATRIAKAIQAPRHLVTYHANKLYEQSVIVNHEVLLNFEKLGFHEFVVYLKLFGYVHMRSKLEDFVRAHANIRWASELLPHYHVRLVFMARSVKEFQVLMDELELLCSTHLLEKEILAQRSFLKKETYSQEKPAEDNRSTPSFSLDLHDKALLPALFSTPTASLLSLSQQSTLSIEGVRNKISRYQQTGLIQGCYAKIDHSKVGYPFWCVLLCDLKNLRSHRRRLQVLLYGDLMFGRTREMFGKWNIEMTLYLPTYEHLVEVIQKLEAEFGTDFGSYSLQVYTQRLVPARIPAVLLQ